VTSDHIVRSFDEDLEALKDAVMRMGGLAEVQVAAAIKAVAVRDSHEARTVVDGDGPIDELEADIDRMVTNLLALRQPMAVDLRGIVAALKISNNLERVGDLAANIAKRSIALAENAEFEGIWLIPRMSLLVQDMIKDALDAYVREDLDLAMAVWRRDAEVDQVYNGIFRELLTYMFENPRNITPSTHLMFIAKNLERIADHGTNIAELVAYVITGERLSRFRPKADETPTYSASPPDNRRIET
jgi:phosphate transport system protein